MDQDRQHETGADTPNRNVRLRVLLAVGALMVLAVALRAYRLGEQSVWYDDWNSVAYLAAPDLSTYMTIVHHRNPEHMPLYFVLQYGWSRMAGTDPESVRWLSVLLHALCIPLIWALGRRLGGNRAGMVAALLFCCSPFNIFHGQSLRSYALVPLLTLCALYSLDRARSGGWRWLAANAAASVLLLYTHVFCALFVAVEGVCLCWLPGGQRRRVLGWAVLVALCALPLLPYGGNRMHMIEQDYDMYVLPTVPQFLCDWVGGDAITLQDGEVMPDGSTWAWLGKQGPALLKRVQPVTDALLVALGAAAALFAVVSLARGKRQGAPDRPLLAVTVAVALAPPVLLLLMSLLLRPCIAQRYTIFSGTALYLLLGFAAVRMRSGALRTLFWVGLCAAYAVGVSATLPAVTRTNWLGVIAAVKEQHGPNDRMFMFMDPSQAGVVKLQTRHLPEFPKAEGVYSTHALLKDVDATLAAGGTAWVTYRSTFGPHTPPAEVHCLEGAGRQVSVTPFLGMDPVFLCRVTATANAANTVASEQVPGPCFVDPAVYEQTLQNAGVLFSDPAEHTAAIASLRDFTDTTVPRDKLALALAGYFVTDGGNPGLGRRLAEASIHLAPEFGFGEMALGYALWRLGDAPAARASFERALSRDAFLALHRPLVTALCETGLSGRTRAEAARLNAMGVDTPRFLSE